MKRLAAVALAVALATAAVPARADPQANAGLLFGGGIGDLRTDAKPVFHMGARASLLFGRESNRDMALGFYVDAVTTKFAALETGGGLDWLIPIQGEFAFGVSAGPFARHDTPQAGWSGGGEATLHLWARSYNFEGPYGITNGLFVQTRYGLGDVRQADVIVGVQIDLGVFGLPMLVLNALVHGS